MNREEAVVKVFLETEGYSEIVHEPDGNIPPDFSVGPIGIEVRRLNQAYQGAGGPRGLEEDRIPLTVALRSVLTDIGPPDSGRSWCVSWRFKRPMSTIKRVKSELREWLTQLEPHMDSGEVALQSGLTLRLLPASRVHATKYVLGPCTDRDSGGFLLSEMRVNITRCLEQKTGKVAPYVHRYSEWWLALVDQIGYGLDISERSRLKNMVAVEEPWTRVLIVNPVDPASSFHLSR